MTAGSISDIAQSFNERLGVSRLVFQWGIVSHTERLKCPPPPKRGGTSGLGY